MGFRFLRRAAGGKPCTSALDALVRLDPGDYRLTVTTFSYVDGIFIEYGAYRELGMTLAMTTAVPVPAAAWLLGSALLGLAGFRRYRPAVTRL